MSAVTDRRVPPGPVEPDPRPLGWLAVGCAVLSALLAPTFFLSVYTFVAAVPALALGIAARGVPQTRRLGTVAVAVTGTACAVAALVLLQGF